MRFRSTFLRVQASAASAYVCLAALGLAACIGNLGSDSSKQSALPLNESLLCEGKVSVVNESALMRLNAHEYRGTIQALFPWANVAYTLPPDGKLQVFENNAASQLTDTHVRAYATAAELIAAAAIQKPRDLTGGCDPAATGDDACFENFLNVMGRRIYRRPLSDSEKSAYREGIYKPTKAESGFTVALQTVVEAMLQSTQFLHRVERGQPMGAAELGLFRLSGIELASRLSYFLWLSGPDDALIDSAQKGELEYQEQVVAQVRRMLKDERSKPMLHAFIEQLFGIARLDEVPKETSLYANWGAPLRASMHRETELFVDETLWEGKGGFVGLLTGSFGFVDSLLAQIYGATAAGTTFTRITFDPSSPRAGILTQPSFLASHAGATDGSVVQRGLTVRRELLCQDLPPPPPGVSQDPKVDRLQDPTCSGCHLRIDPIGRGFSRFDAIGQYNASAGSDSGELTGVTGVEPVFQGVPALGSKISATADFNTCASKQWLRFALNRLESDSDTCMIDNIGKILQESGGDVREAIVAIASHELFRMRKSEAVSACQ